MSRKKEQKQQDTNKYLGYSAEIIKKCLSNEPPACQTACPLHIDNRRMISLIHRGKFKEALNMVLETVPFPKILGRVCVGLCENVCKRIEIDKTIAISSLIRFITEAEKYVVDVSVKEEKDAKIAIVGSGPAGLMAAYYLRKKGYKITIYEAEPFLGGALRLYLPDFRLPKDIVEEELSFIPKMGIEVKLNTKLGKDISLQELKNNYNAIFLALGTQKSFRLGIRGENLNGVFYSIDFLKKVNTKQSINIGKNIAVIGGGSIAIDVARTALRLGAEEVKILYRRTKAEMPAHEEGIKKAEEEGIKIEILTAPVEILGKDKVEAIRCIKTDLGSYDKSGRRYPIPIDSSEFEIPVDQVIIAIGLTTDLESIKNSHIKTTKWNTINVNPNTLETNMPGIFAGGDVVSGPDTVIGALAHGRQAAFAIDTYIRFGKVNYTPYEIRPWKTKPIDVKKVKRFIEIEPKFDHETAIKEAERCIQCDCKRPTCRRCVKVCSFLENYCFNPKELVAQFQSLKKDELIIPYTCNICSLCETVCPQNLNIGTLCMEVREKLVHLSLAPLSKHKSIISNQKWGTSKYFTLNIPDIETKKCEWVFFPGCALPSYSPDLVLKTYNYLRKEISNVGIVLNCCGAPTHLMGDMENFRKILKNTLDSIYELGTNKVILACPDCYHTFKDFAPELELTTVYHIIAEHGVPEPLAKEDIVFSIHDSCVTRHEEDLHESIRYIVKKLNYNIEELDYSRKKTRCCGAGGMAFHANRDFIIEVIKKRANESTNDYLVYCAGCLLTFAFVKKPVFHVLDLIFSPNLKELRLKPPPNPLIKWTNRWKLKKRFQKIKK